MDWITFIKTDENTALSQLYKEQKHICTHWLSKTYQIPIEECEEIFQVSIVILYDNIVSGKLTKLTSKIDTYIIGIAKNQARVLLNRKHKDQKIQAELSLENYISETINPDFEKNLVQVEKALLQLGDPCKSLLELFYYNKLDMTEIANRMSYKNRDTVKNLKYKCIKRLQKLYFNYKELRSKNI